MVLSRAHLDTVKTWFARQLRQYYGPTPAIPPECGKPEIDEMRILSHWVEQTREKGSRIIYIDPEWETSVVKFERELHEIFNVKIGEPLVTILAPAREKKLVLRPMKA